MCQNIDRYMDTHAMLVCKCDSFFHIVMAEILRLSTQSKDFSADIYRISTKYNCCF